MAGSVRGDATPALAGAVGAVPVDAVPVGDGTGPAPTQTSDQAATQAPAQAPAHPTRKRWLLRLRRVVSIGLVAVGVIVAIGKRGEIARAFDGLRHPDWWWLVVAVAFQASSMVVFARLQRWLLKCGGIKVRLRDMVEITLAGNALSTSIPGGAAWAAGWIWGQLRRRDVDRVLAGWVVLVAGALASFALFLYVVAGSFLAGSKGPVAPLRWIGIALLGLGVAILVTAIVVARSEARARRWAEIIDEADGAPGIKATLLRAVNSFGQQIRVVTPSPLAWVEALLLAGWNWAADLATLIFTIFAVHGSVPWRGVVIAYALTQIAASIPITPGGLAVVEASLTALLTAYGMPATEAVTVVLLYRIISFWALVPIGWGAWGYLEWVGRGRTGHHPWAFHRHAERPEAPAGDRPRSGPERLRRTGDCVGCEEAPRDGEAAAHGGEEAPDDGDEVGTSLAGTPGS